MLSGGELRDLYSKDFALFEADPPSSYAQDDELRKLTTHSYIPVFVFLDAGGKKVAETRGFRDEREAKGLHEYVAKRHYLKMNIQDFLATYKP